MRLKLISLLLVVAIWSPAFAYDLRPSKSARLFKDQTHELLTIASIKCKRATLAASPTLRIEDWNCLPAQKNFVSDYSGGRWTASLREDAKDDHGLDVQYLLEGVRWPDDPTGLLRSNLPIRGLLNFIQCNKWLKGRYGPCSNRFCNSHFGHAQMAHSMRPAAYWCNPESPDSTTCTLVRMEPRLAIENWIQWLIPIGQGIDPAADVFANPLAKSFFDQDNCPKVYPPGFNYRSLFFVDCSKGRAKKLLKFWRWADSWGKCPEDPPEEDDELNGALKARAIGAILHVIQDSYARGHTLRVATEKTKYCSPRISCTEIRRFSDYSQQSGTKHGKADKNPAWDASCLNSDRKVDDPITAGAKVLAMFEDGSSAERISNYLSTKVFVMGDAPTKDQLRMDNECFGK